MAEPVLHDDGHGRGCLPAVGVYPARIAPSDALDLYAERSSRRVAGKPFFLSRLAITTLSVSVILTFVNTSPVLLMEVMGFDRGEYATTMAMTAGISMAVSFSTPFALSILNPAS